MRSIIGHRDAKRHRSWCARTPHCCRPGDLADISSRGLDIDSCCVSVPVSPSTISVPSPFPPDDLIIAVAGIDGIVPGVTLDRVVPSPAGDRIACRPGDNIVIAIATIRGDLRRGTDSGERVVASPTGKQHGADCSAGQTVDRQRVVAV